MMKFMASILVFMMTFNASADANEEAIMQALMNPAPTESELNHTQIAHTVRLNSGDKAPFQGLLVDKEMFDYINERIDKIDAAEAAMVKQNDYLIDTQIKLVTLEFERDNARAKVKEYNMVSGIFWVFLGIIVGSTASK